MIKAILLDLGNTIVPFDFQHAYQAMTKRTGLAADEIRSRIGATDLVTRFESGQIGSQPFVDELCGLLDLTMPFEEFRDLWFSVFMRPTLLSDEFVAALGARYPLVLLSNTNTLHFEMLEQNYPILRHFSRRALSNVVGAMKPSPIIYEAAVRLAGVKPHECYFADDIQAYVDGAIANGIDAVRFENQSHLERELAARGVTW